jgi:lipoprotein-anchoring transpeptidase ErfK/SrfK
MDFYFEKIRAAKAFVFVFSLAAVLATAGCEPPKTTTNANVAVNTTTANTATNSAANATQNVSEANKNLESQMPVTLPVLDAMFSDESFAGDLKSKLQLTDEQIDKLKNISRQATAGLRESDDASGSTRASMERAGQQIKEVVGENNANKFFEFVRQRWSGGDETADASGNATGNPAGKINSIPTDTRVVVNAPAYRMDLFQDGKLVKTYKIGIGYPEFPLPSGMRKANELIFNPTWTPPDEPWVEASNKIKAGEKVAAGDKLNPLGPIKIPIGLPSLIHGGKNPAKLGTFASHGCVGLTNKQVQDFSLDLAKISGIELTREDVAAYEKQKTETKNVKLGKSIPVELRYETIVVEDGKLRIFRDVYEKGTNTEENLLKVFETYGVSFDSLNEQVRQKILAGLKQMAYDATGNPVDANAASNVNSNMNSNKSANGNTNLNAKGNSKSQGEQVTRSVKGSKEVVFDLAELKGKGYPAPVAMNMGK